MLRVVETAAFTDTGRQRRVNEDALLSRTPLFDAPVDISDNAPTIDKLVALTGRDPEWKPAP